MLTFMFEEAHVLQKMLVLDQHMQILICRGLQTTSSSSWPARSMVQAGNAAALHLFFPLDFPLLHRKLGHGRIVWITSTANKCTG